MTGRNFARPPQEGALTPSWKPWREGTVRQIALSIDEERAFGRLPELADALEEAGCTDPDILAHCRSFLPHARGCWLLDALLGKT